VALRQSCRAAWRISLRRRIKSARQDQPCGIAVSVSRPDRTADAIKHRQQQQNSTTTTAIRKRLLIRDIQARATGTSAGHVAGPERWLSATTTCAHTPVSQRHRPPAQKFARRAFRQISRHPHRQRALASDNMRSRPSPAGASMSLPFSRRLRYLQDEGKLLNASISSATNNPESGSRCHFGCAVT